MTPHKAEPQFVANENDESQMCCNRWTNESMMHHPRFLSKNPMEALIHDRRGAVGSTQILEFFDWPAKHRGSSCQAGGFLPCRAAANWSAAEGGHLADAVHSRHRWEQIRHVKLIVWWKCVAAAVQTARCDGVHIYIYIYIICIHIY